MFSPEAEDEAISKDETTRPVLSRVFRLIFIFCISMSLVAAGRSPVVDYDGWFDLRFAAIGKISVEGDDAQKLE